MRLGLFEALLEAHVLGHFDCVIDDVVVLFADIELTRLLLLGLMHSNIYTDIRTLLYCKEKNRLVIGKLSKRSITLSIG